MTNPIAVSQRAKALWSKLDDYTFKDHQGKSRLDGEALTLLARFEAEIRADEREKPARMKAAEIESAIAAAIRAHAAKEPTL